MTTNVEKHLAHVALEGFWMTVQATLDPEHRRTPATTEGDDADHALLQDYAERVVGRWMKRRFITLAEVAQKWPPSIPMARRKTAAELGQLPPSGKSLLIGEFRRSMMEASQVLCRAASTARSYAETPAEHFEAEAVWHIGNLLRVVMGLPTYAIDQGGEPMDETVEIVAPARYTREEIDTWSERRVREVYARDVVPLLTPPPSPKGTPTVHAMREALVKLCAADLKTNLGTKAAGDAIELNEHFELLNGHARVRALHALGHRVPAVQLLPDGSRNVWIEVNKKVTPRTEDDDG